MSAPNMESVAEKELPRVKIIYYFGGDPDIYGGGGVGVKVLAPTDFDGVHQDGPIFSSYKRAESWVSQRFNVTNCWSRWNPQRLEGGSKLAVKAFEKYLEALPKD